MGIALLFTIIRFFKFPAARKQQSLANIPLLVPWGIYLLAAVISSIFGIDPARSIRHLPSDIIKAVTFFLLIYAIRPQDTKKLVSFYLAGALAAAILGIGQVVYFYLKYNFIVRVHGTMHPVFYGEIISLALGLGICRFITAGKTDKPLAGILFLLTLGAALILSQTRGAYMAAAVTITCCFVFYSAGRKKIIQIVLVAGIFLSVACYFNSNLRHKIYSMPASIYMLAQGKLLSDSKLGDANKIRLSMWKTGARIFIDFPLFGVGPANVKRIFHYYHPGSLDGKFGWSNVHNLYLQQAAERGILGLGALLFLLISMLFLSWKFFKKNRNVYTLCAFSSLCGFLVMNITQTSFQHAVVSMSMMFLFALSYAECRKPKKS